MTNAGYMPYATSERAHVTKDLTNMKGGKVNSKSVNSELTRRWKALPESGRELWAKKAR